VPAAIGIVIADHQALRVREKYQPGPLENDGRIVFNRAFRTSHRRCRAIDARAQQSEVPDACR
jgi:hypothetical protein